LKNANIIRPWCLQHACLSTPKTRLEQIDTNKWL
jgi:hypothetical protein